MFTIGELTQLDPLRWNCRVTASALLRCPRCVPGLRGQDDGACKRRGAGAGLF